MLEAANEERRVGRLRVRAQAAPGQNGSIEIRRESLDSPGGAFRSRFAWLALMGIAVALIGFSVRVRSFPGLGIGALLVVLLALIAIVRGRRPPAIVRVQGTEVRITSFGGSIQLPLERVERLGVGRDMDPLHTVWVAVRGSGRVLLLDGLTAEEAELAAASLRPFVPGEALESP
jgi:hypothetical protein